MPRAAETPAQQYQRYRRALGAAALPSALVDLDALDANIDAILAPVREAGRTLRIATKSLRCPALLEHIAERGGSSICGLMTYTAAETAWLAGRGFGDLLLAYPTASAADAALLAQANRGGAVARAIVDDVAQLAVLEEAAAAAGLRLPVVIDVDMAYRRCGARLYLGVRRSPLHEPADVVALATRIAASPTLSFGGILGYEAHVAGLTDANPFSRGTNAVKRAIKRLAIPDIARQRRATVQALCAAGLEPGLVNGGGSGSLRSSLAEGTLTEVTAGSGFVGSLLFDAYQGLHFEAALCFALQVVRRPGPGLVTCHGGGFVASGQAGPDKLPRPWLPEGLHLLEMEGAGEVQTPLRHGSDLQLALGDPVFFRHAKAGELAEHVRDYLLLRGETVTARAPTYRGLDLCFLG